MKYICITAAFWLTFVLFRSDTIVSYDEISSQRFYYGAHRSDVRQSCP